MVCYNINIGENKMIIYAYRDATDAIQKILDEYLDAGLEEKQTLIDVCRDFLDREGFVSFADRLGDEDG